MRGAEARPLHDDLMGAMREAIEGTVGEDGVIEERDPLLHRPVAGDNGRGPTVTFDEHIVEVTGLLGSELTQAEVVELCGAPHNSTYGERSVMWSAPSKSTESSGFSYS